MLKYLLAPQSTNPGEDSTKVNKAVPRLFRTFKADASHIYLFPMVNLQPKSGPSYTRREYLPLGKTQSFE